MHGWGGSLLSGKIPLCVLFGEFTARFEGAFICPLGGTSRPLLIIRAAPPTQTAVTVEDVPVVVI